MKLSQWVTEYLVAEGKSNVELACELRVAKESSANGHLVSEFAGYFEEKGWQLLQIAYFGTDEEKEAVLSEL